LRADSDWLFAVFHIPAPQIHEDSPTTAMA
jgi:hypothetical protein